MTTHAQELADYCRAFEGCPDDIAELAYRQILDRGQAEETIHHIFGDTPDYIYNPKLEYPVIYAVHDHEAMDDAIYRHSEIALEYYDEMFQEWDIWDGSYNPAGWEAMSQSTLDEARRILRASVVEDQTWLQERYIPEVRGELERTTAVVVAVNRAGRSITIAARGEERPIDGWAGPLRNNLTKAVDWDENGECWRVDLGDLLTYFDFDVRRGHLNWEAEAPAYPGVGELELWLDTDDPVQVFDHGAPLDL